jgi:hypothetical protein
MDSVNLENGYTAKVINNAPHLVGNIYMAERWVGSVIITTFKGGETLSMSSNSLSGFLSLESLQIKIDDLGAIKELYKVMEGVNKPAK